MTTISDTQAIILSAAAQRADRIALPLPDTLKGGARQKVVGAMLKKGLLEEVDADLRKGEPAWRETGDGHGVTLVATDAGLAAIGVELGPVPTARTEPAGAETVPAEQMPAEPEAAPTGADAALDAPKPRKIREGTKQAKLIEMLRAEGGATIDEIVAALEWRPHTVRGAIAGALKKKLGLTITSEKVEGRGRTYMLPRD